MEKHPERGARLRALRQEAGRSQRALAEAVGVTERAYQAWEGGGNIAWPNVVALARVLDTTPDTILDGVEPGEIIDPQELRIRRLETQVASAELGVIERVAALEAQIRELAEPLSDLVLAVQSLVSAATAQQQLEAFEHERSGERRSGRDRRASDARRSQ